jgi:hypothetical protein
MGGDRRLDDLLPESDSLDSVPASSMPTSFEYPTTSATMIAASLRCLIALPPIRRTLATGSWNAIGRQLAAARVRELKA